MSDSNSFFKFKSMIGLKGRDLNETKNSKQNSFISLNNITISSTLSLNSIKGNSMKRMRRFLTATKLTRNKSSILSPKNLNDELDAKQRAEQREKERIRPSISSPLIVDHLKPKNRIPMTPLSSGQSNSRMFCRQSSKLWIESIPKEVINEFRASFSPYEYKRQEAIYELLTGEMDLCYDLGLIEATYQNSLIHLEIIDETEAFQIFGDLHALHTVHSWLVKQLETMRDRNGVFMSIGRVLVEWAPQLEVYVNYCANQRTAKQLLEMKIKSDKRLNDFLQRCLQSPFSRRLDLWSFLDVPRNRLVKYPLLLRAIKKYSSETSFDYKAIECAINLMEKIISNVDFRMGEEECIQLVSKMEFDRNCETNQCIIDAKAIICSGTLRNSRGTKLLCVLFDTCFAMTRKSDSDLFVLYRQPIVIEELRFESGANIKPGGSLNRTFNGLSDPNKIFVFRVYSTLRDITFTLHAKDSNNLRLWVNKLTQVLDKNKIKQMTNNPTIPKIMSRVLKETNRADKPILLGEGSPRKKIKLSNPNVSEECFV